MDTHAFLAQLRECLYVPSARSWARLVACFEAAREADADVGVGVDYALGHLEGWPWRLREAPWSWVEEALEGRPPLALRLAASLRLEGRKGLHHAVPRLLGLPHLSGLRGLVIDNTRIGGQRSIKALLGARYTERLQELRLAQVGLRDDQLAMLLSASELRGLEVLHLERNALTPEAVARLGRCGAVLRLRELHLDDNPLGLEGVRALARVPFERLRVLSLGGAQVCDAGLKALASSPHLGDLEHLEIPDCAFGARGLRALTRSALAQRLGSLSAWSNALGEEGGRALGGAGAWPRLHTLGVANSGLTDGGLRAMLEAQGAFGALVRLDVRHNWLHAESLGVLEEHGRLGALEQVLLGLNALEQRGELAAFLGRPEGFERLRVLELAHVGLSPSSAQGLERLRAPRLERLDVSYNALRDEGARHLAAATGLRGLRVLSVAGCGLSDAGAALLAGCGPRLPRLGALYMHGNGLSEAGLERLTRARFLRLRAVSAEVEGEAIGPSARAAFAARYEAPPPLTVVREASGDIAFHMDHRVDFREDVAWFVDALDREEEAARGAGSA